VRLAILSYADGKSNTQPVILLVAQLCQAYNCTPADLRRNDLGELLRVQDALVTYDAARKPLTKRSPSEARLMAELLKADMER